jgi:hypothetical protein
MDPVSRVCSQDEVNYHVMRGDLGESFWRDADADTMPILDFDPAVISVRLPPRGQAHAKRATRSDRDAKEIIPPITYAQIQAVMANSPRLTSGSVDTTGEAEVPQQQKPSIGQIQNSIPYSPYRFFASLDLDLRERADAPAVSLAAVKGPPQAAPLAPPRQPYTKNFVADIISGKNFIGSVDDGEIF